MKLIVLILLCIDIASIRRLVDGTDSPTLDTSAPTAPTAIPTVAPSASTSAPTLTTSGPTSAPSASTTVPTPGPTNTPTMATAGPTSLIIETTSQDQDSGAGPQNVPPWLQDAMDQSPVALDLYQFLGVVGGILISICCCLCICLYCCFCKKKDDDWDNSKNY